MWLCAWFGSRRGRWIVKKSKPEDTMSYTQKRMPRRQIKAVKI
jgi:hypothetical protein